MSPVQTNSIPLPSVLAQKAVAARQRCERGRRLILWGWVGAMAGVTGACRAIFHVGPETELMDALTGTGPLGWTSLALLFGGVGLWLAGNLVYLREVLEAPDAEKEG